MMRASSRLLIPITVATLLLGAILWAGNTPFPYLTAPDLHNVAFAQTADTPTTVPTATPDEDSGVQDLPPIEGKVNPPQYPNMDSHLNRIVEETQTGQFTAQAAAASAPIHRKESVAVTLYITEGYADAIAAYLESNGGDPRNIGVDYIEAYIPVSLLPAAAELEGVLSIRTIIPPQPAQGAVVSEGAAAHGAPAWHDAGIKGSGVKIGVIDIGFRGFQSLMGTELPASVMARCYTDIGVFTSSLDDCDNADASVHGAAVTESLFDIAPEATYYISNSTSHGDLQTAVQWMIDNDVDVINQSLSWGWDGPGDGTSPFSNSPLRAVDAAVESGAAWVNSAGNGTRHTWFGPFEDTDGDRIHNYGVNLECNHIDLKASETVTLVLRWDDSWLGASRDLDLYLILPDASGRYLFENAVSSEDEQSGRFGDYPIEVISGSVRSDLTACIAVRQQRGAAPAWMQLLSRRFQDLELHTLSGGITNPAESANPGLLAVGAAPWSNTSSIEPYSDQGPAPDGRTKPDIVGADLGQTVSYRSTDNPNGYFAGTSQASPHVAGLAALVKQRFPEKGPEQVAQYLKDHAERRGAVPNNTWGHGFASLPAPVAATSTPAPTNTPAPTATPEPAVPTELENRVSVLEGIVGTLKGLIAALESRVAALELSSTPEPTPTPTPVIPTPTPTPTPTPGITPEPTEEPSPTPTPVADACLTLITSDGEVLGSWDGTCPSTNRPLDATRPDNRNYYARYYSFTLSENSDVIISLSSADADTFLYLLEGEGRDGTVVQFNDDIERGNTNSQMSETLEAGDYTVEATTYGSDVTGDFTLSISGVQ